MVEKLRAKLTPTNVLISMMGLCIILVGISITTGVAATTRAQAALDTANDTRSSLNVHVAQQKGQFETVRAEQKALQESIDSQFGTLRTYHGDTRREIKDTETKLREDMKELMNYLLKHIHGRSDYSSSMSDTIPPVASSTN